MLDFELKVLERKTSDHNRGLSDPVFCAQELSRIAAQHGHRPSQHTLTAYCRTVRRMHFQHPPYAEVKAVSSLRNPALDVAVGLRWHAELL